jgi:hypothetical protein
VELYRYQLRRGAGVPDIIGYTMEGDPVFEEKGVPFQFYHPRTHEPVPIVRGGADGIFYVDSRPPFLIADQGNITLGTAMKALWGVGAGSPTILPANYWTLGKRIRLTANLKWTAVANTNTIQVAMAYGAADAPAAVVAATAVTPVSGTSVFSVYITGNATCRSIGTAGTLSMWGICHMPAGLTAGGAQPFPSAGVTVVSTVDTTVGTNALFFEALRATAGTDTVAATDIFQEALN